MRWYGRLRRSGDIAFVRRRGRSASAPSLTGYAVGAAGPVLVGITVSKAVGGATVRNLVRRRIRSALDRLENHPAGLRFLLVAKPASASRSYAAVAADVTSTVRRLAAAP